jgi:hypothetical protein
VFVQRSWGIRRTDPASRLSERGNYVNQPPAEACGTSSDNRRPPGADKLPAQYLGLDEITVYPRHDLKAEFAAEVAARQEKAALDAPYDEHDGAGDGGKGTNGQSGGSPSPNMSDVRAKRDIKAVAVLASGLHLYHSDISGAMTNMWA